MDATNYVALGNSFTAGYADNALYNGAQQTSYPNLLAQQFKMIQGGKFVQPLVDPTSVGYGASSGNAYLTLAPAADCNGAISLAPVPVAAKGDLNVFAPVSGGPFNNIGVPGAMLIHMVVSGYGSTGGNPYFGRMASNVSTSSMLSDAANQNPSFFSLYGSDDVLEYALSGGTDGSITPSVGAPGFGYDATVDVILSTLTANKAKGVIGSMPDVTTFPYFNTIPYNGLVLDAANAAALSAAYAPLGISFQPGKNGFIIQDNKAPGGMRQIQSGEMVLLSTPQDSLKCGGWGSQKPIPDQYVLTTKEITEIRNATSAYNAKLKASASTNGLAYVDVNNFMGNLSKGIMYNGVAINSQFVSGGAFSLDGIHLSPKGNALLANEFIKSINLTYGSTIPQLDANKYKGVAFP
ncbi:MAG: SGNH/GDSL hydrolase family protein [Flavisolibacter sp.]